MALGKDFFGLILAELIIYFTVLGRLHAEDRDRQQRGVDCAWFSDGEGPHWDAGRHLYD